VRTTSSIFTATKPALPDAAPLRCSTSARTRMA
jgi:hypothetical protein